jgi:hypothetical protein
MPLGLGPTLEAPIGSVLGPPGRNISDSEDPVSDFAGGQQGLPVRSATDSIGEVEFAVGQPFCVRAGAHSADDQVGVQFKPADLDSPVSVRFLNGFDSNSKVSHDTGLVHPCLRLFPQMSGKEALHWLRSQIHYRDGKPTLGESRCQFRANGPGADDDRTGRSCIHGAAQGKGVLRGS